MPRRIVIIGNGITGVTTARFIRKQSDAHLTVISAESDHFYARTALMYLYMGHLTYAETKPYEDHFWAKNRIELVRDYVQAIDVDAKRVVLSAGTERGYDALVLATGSQSNLFGWPGQTLPGVQGLYGLADLAQMEQQTTDIRHAVIVGGGLIGVEMAEMLHTRHIPVTFLVREQSYMDYLLPPEESALVNRHLRRHGIDLRLHTELAALLPGDDGRVKAAKTKAGEEIACGFVGLTVGVHPNMTLVKDSPVETNRGILVNRYFETSVPGVYAAGDCAEFREPLPGRKPIEQLWYTGRAHGQTLAQTLCGHRTAYAPGVFFNSAKFFDVEYQTYGTIHPQRPEGIGTVYWEHSDGEKSIRIDYREADRAVIGFNLMGVRYRQAVCAGWVAAGTPVEAVLENLGTANFDPEFFRQHEAAVLAVYNDAHPGAPIRLKRKRGLFSGMLGNA